ncbi:hypothetical protein [Lyngbya sp. PCC 8106]|uniref:hypothetical protein n=1 Tax=Lyngbya sp. (strain PCC 8106) TaxID=313612 RepID=UPI0000EA9139|nr:hypothetical protein [Lyngbya sp. PCC 8106]EAW35112.1 hypothetical protein L8106_27539 [Lyngbya sp. PCC 8106]
MRECLLLTTGHPYLGQGCFILSHPFTASELAVLADDSLPELKIAGGDGVMG